MRHFLKVSVHLWWYILWRWNPSHYYGFNCNKKTSTLTKSDGWTKWKEVRWDEHPLCTVPLWSCKRRRRQPFGGGITRLNCCVSRTLSLLLWKRYTTLRFISLYEHKLFDNSRGVCHRCWQRAENGTRKPSILDAQEVPVQNPNTYKYQFMFLNTRDLLVHLCTAYSLN